MTTRIPCIVFVILSLFLAVTERAAAQQSQVIVSNFNQRPLCIDVPNSQYAAGTQIVVYPCQRSQNQYFKFTQQGLVTAYANFCVDAYRPSGGVSQVGDVIGLWNCHGGPNQNWFLQAAAPTPPGQTPALFNIMVQAGLCMTVTAYDAQRQTGRLTLARCNNTPAQVFRFSQ